VSMPIFFVVRSLIYQHGPKRWSGPKDVHEIARQPGGEAVSASTHARWVPSQALACRQVEVTRRAEP
jgi:hypothetical protein